MDPPLLFISTMRPNRPNFLVTMTAGEEAVMQRHFAYVQQVFDQGKLLLGGAAADGAIGVLIYRVESAEEAQQIFDGDPAVQAGIGQTELHPFRVGFLFGA